MTHSQHLRPERGPSEKKGRGGILHSAYSMSSYIYFTFCALEQGINAGNNKRKSAILSEQCWKPDEQSLEDVTQRFDHRGGLCIPSVIENSALSMQAQHIRQD